MTVPTTTYGDNKYQPGVSQVAYVPDQLIGGTFPLETQPIILASGSLLRGTVLGETSGQAITAAAAGTNSGNGTVANLSRSAGSEEGAYVLTAKSANTFGVVDPEGSALPDLTVGQAYAQRGLNLTVNAGANAFAAGDKFTLSSLDATGQYIACVKTATDGSQVPKAILVDDADATNGPVAAGAYLTGEFNQRAILYDPSWTIAQLRDALRGLSIFLKASVSAAEPVS